MIKVNGEYLDFDDVIEVERQIKLFQDVETSDGDFSYSFNLPKTQKNLSAIGNPTPDSVKTIYQNVECDLVDDSGILIQSGSLMIERITDVIACSFFGGNNNWFGLLNQPMSSLPGLYKYDVNLTESNIQASWLNDSGIIFPILDTGALITRSFSNLKIEDFTGCFYVKTLFNEIFNTKGIKLEGDFINDPTFKKLIVASNRKSQDDVNGRSSYIQKTTAQNNIPSGPDVKITFQNESVFPFNDGNLNNYSITDSRYTADVKMNVNIDVTLKSNIVPPGEWRLRIYKNGSVFFTWFSVPEDFTGKIESMVLEAGDYIELFIEEADPGAGNSDVLGGTFKVSPIFIYRSFGTSSVPNWSQGEFVSNILRLFNVLPSYNITSKTLTLDLFNKIKSKQPIDVSEEITIEEIDFTEFVVDYGKSSYFKYQESDDEDLRKYNISNSISYGSGSISINNDFIEDSVDILESDFTSPITYLNGIFDMSIERFNFVELEDIDDKSISSVTNSSGTPRFNISSADDLFSVGDLIRLETDVDSYNGDWIVSTVTSTYIVVNGLSFDSSTTGTATLLRHKFTTDDNVYLFVNVPNINNLFFSSKSSIMLGSSTSFSSAALAYFNLLSNGREINAKYKQGLSFGSINNPLSYQLSVIDTYWPIFEQILNDPVMLKVIAYFGLKKYDELKTFLRPLRVKTNETNNLYYLNRISGYQGSHLPCNAELIKL